MYSTPDVESFPLQKCEVCGHKTAWVESIEVGIAIVVCERCDSVYAKIADDLKTWAQEQEVNYLLPKKTPAWMLADFNRKLRWREIALEMLRATLRSFKVH